MHKIVHNLCFSSTLAEFRRVFDFFYLCGIIFWVIRLAKNILNVAWFVNVKKKLKDIKKSDKKENFMWTEFYVCVSAGKNRERLQITILIKIKSEDNLIWETHKKTVCSSQ